MTEVVVVGLTGSIAMGKSTTARMFRSFGWPLFDADLAVHDLMAPGGAAVGPVLDAFADVGGAAGGIDRQRLGAVVFQDPAALARLEGILHPRVRAAERAFVGACRRNGDHAVVLDIPLLFETNAARRCDLSVVVSAPAYVQERRVLARPGMTRERLRAVLAKQMPDREKRRRADFVVGTGQGRAAALADVRAVVAAGETMFEQKRGKRR